MKILLNAEETGVLLKQDPATRGQGGWQNLMLNFQDRLNKTTGELSLGDSDLDNIRRYAFSRGNGGWEQRLGEIFGRHLGPKLDARST